MRRGKVLIMIDNGAQISFVNDKRLIHAYRDAQPPFNAVSFSGHSVDMLGYGYLFIDFDDIYFKIQCWYSPQVADNIISGGFMDDNDCLVRKITGDPPSYCLTYEQRSIPIITVDSLKYISSANILLPPPVVKINSIHSRLGHINASYILRSAHKGTIVGIKPDEIEELKSFYTTHDCTSCLLGKARRANAVEGSIDPYREPVPFNVVYSDICQITEQLQPSRERYIITFKCGFTKFLKIYPMENKSDAYWCINSFIQWVKNQFRTQGYSVKTLFSDQGSEYLSDKVYELLNQEGIETHVTSAYTPASNGVAERVNLTIMQDVRSMLISSSLPSYFWVEAALYSVLLRNHVYSDALGTSPASYLGFSPLDVRRLREFGEKCYVTNLPYGGKVDQRSSTAIYLGYSASTYGHRVFVPTTDGSVDSGYFICSRHVNFTKVPSLYFSSPHEESYSNLLFTLHDNPMSIDIEDNTSYGNTLDNYFHHTVSVESDNDYEMIDYEDTDTNDVEMVETDSDEKLFILNHEIAEEDESPYNMDLENVRENELVEDQASLLQELLANNDTAEIKHFNDQSDSVAKRTRGNLKINSDDQLPSFDPYQSIFEFNSRNAVDQENSSITNTESIRTKEHVEGKSTDAENSSAEQVSNLAPMLEIQSPPHPSTNLGSESTESISVPIVDQASSHLITIADSTGVPRAEITTSPSSNITVAESDNNVEELNHIPEPTPLPPVPSSTTPKTKKVSKKMKSTISNKKKTTLKSTDSGKKSKVRSTKPPGTALPSDNAQSSVQPPPTATETETEKLDLSQKEGLESPISLNSSQPSHKSEIVNSHQSNDLPTRPDAKGKNPTEEALACGSDSVSDNVVPSGSDEPVSYDNSDSQTHVAVPSISGPSEGNSDQPKPSGVPMLAPSTSAADCQTSVASRTRLRKPNVDKFDDSILGRNVAKVNKPESKKTKRRKTKSTPALVADLTSKTAAPATASAADVTSPSVDNSPPLTQSEHTVPENSTPINNSRLQESDSHDVLDDLSPSSEMIFDPPTIWIGESLHDDSSTPPEKISRKEMREQKLYQRSAPKYKLEPQLLRRSARLQGKSPVKSIKCVLVNKVTVNPLINPTGKFPKSYKAAIHAHDSESWHKAIDSELDSHNSLGTWDPQPILVDRNDLRLKKTIHTKWVFTIKGDGTYKARLVARGDLQDSSTYNETHSPTLRPEIARTILSQNASLHWYFKQFDFKTAYLNSQLNTEIYIHPPQGYLKQNTDPAKRVIYQLKRGLYGLKQAGRLWHFEISKTLKNLGYSKHGAFPSTFVKKKADEVISIIGLFVDDMIVSTKHLNTMTELSNSLQKFYQLKEIEADVNGMQRFLGINMYVIRAKNGTTKSIEINQDDYIQSMIEEYNIEPNVRVKTPLPPGYYFDTSKEENKLLSSDHALKLAKTEYRKRIGSLLYVSVMTRLDITYAVNYLAQFCEYPHPALFSMINRVFEYLNNTKEYSLVYKNRWSKGLDFYTDSDYAQEPVGRKSMNAFLVQVNGNIVFWKSKYTALTCGSSAEAELQAIYIASNESVWFRQLVIYLGILPNDTVGKYWVDNNAIVLSLNSGNFSSASKHYAVRLHTVRERLELPDKDDPFSENGIRFVINHISGEDQLADILTKPVTTKVMEKLTPLLLQTPEK